MAPVRWHGSGHGSVRRPNPTWGNDEEVVVSRALAWRGGEATGAWLRRRRWQTVRPWRCSNTTSKWQRSHGQEH
jgi:hypothetical protein